MPEKSLPFYRDENLPENQQSSHTTFGSGPNLIIQDEILPANFAYLKTFANLFKKLSFVIVIVFGLMLIANFFLDLKLQSQRIMINQLGNQVGVYTLERSQAQDVDKKTKFYQATLSRRFLMGDKSTAVFSNLTDAITVTSVTIQPDKFDMTIEVPTPLDFAFLISKYLSSDHIAQITLRSADLISQRKTFRVTLGGTFK